MHPPNGTSEGRVVYKAGKLIRVRAVFDDERIVDIRITGDFFLYPEEKLEHIEEKLRNRRLSDADGIIREELSDAEYEGISPEELSRAIREAWLRRR